MTSLSPVALNCTLKRGSRRSSTDLLLGQVLAELGRHNVATADPIRVADVNVKPGVSSDEGDGDA